MKNNWICFFSQTGAEIADIAESLGRWPAPVDNKVYWNIQRFRWFWNSPEARLF